MTEIKLLLGTVTIPVTNLYDADGNEVEKWDEAVSFVAGPLPDGQWVGGMTSDFKASEEQ